MLWSPQVLLVKILLNPPSYFPRSNLFKNLSICSYDQSELLQEIHPISTHKKQRGSCYLGSHCWHDLPLCLTLCDRWHYLSTGSDMSLLFTSLHINTKISRFYTQCCFLHLNHWYWKLQSSQLDLHLNLRSWASPMIQVIVL